MVGYTICGALVFQFIETDSEADDYLADVNTLTNTAVNDLWSIQNNFNVLNERQSKIQFHHVLNKFQQNLVVYIQKGYDGSSLNDRWTFPNALMYTLSIITTIGYSI